MKCVVSQTIQIIPTLLAFSSFCFLIINCKIKFEDGATHAWHSQAFPCGRWWVNVSEPTPCPHLHSCGGPSLMTPVCILLPFPIQLYSCKSNYVRGVFGISKRWVVIQLFNQIILEVCNLLSQLKYILICCVCWIISALSFMWQIVDTPMTEIYYLFCNNKTETFSSFYPSVISFQTLTDGY